MLAGIMQKRQVSPIISYDGSSVIAEASAFAEPICGYVGSSSEIGEVVQSSIGSLAFCSSSSPICEGISPATWSNQQMSQSDVICEAIVDNLLVGASTGGGTISIYDEGSLISAAVTCLDFKGVDIIAKNGTGSCIEIWSPAPSFASHFNTVDGVTNGVVPNVATSLRYVASPTVEGTPFYANGWDNGITHPATRTSPLVYTTPQPVSFVDSATHFIVTIKDGNIPQGTVLNYNTGNITGDGTYSVANVSVTVSGWMAESDKFKATVSVSINIAALFPNSGYFDVSIQHVNGTDGTFTKTQ